MQFIDLNVQESWTLLLFGGLLLWAVRKNLLWIAIVSALSIPAVVVLRSTEFSFFGAIFLLILGIIIQYFTTGFDRDAGVKDA